MYLGSQKIENAWLKNKNSPKMSKNWKHMDKAIQKILKNVPRGGWGGEGVSKKFGNTWTKNKKQSKKNPPKMYLGGGRGWGSLRVAADRTFLPLLLHFAMHFKNGAKILMMKMISAVRIFQK